MKLNEGKIIGEAVIQWLNPFCERAMIAGSIRRLKPTPKDIEVVYIPQLVTAPGHQLTLFGEAEVKKVPATVAGIEALIRKGVWALDTKVQRNGPRYQRLRMTEQGLNQLGLARLTDDPPVVELFRAESDNWGYILALRTGPGDFNRLWVSYPPRGVLPYGLHFLEGQLLTWGGHVVPTETEEDLFDRIGIPCWAPWVRSTARLEQWRRGG